MSKQNENVSAETATEKPAKKAKRQTRIMSVAEYEGKPEPKKVKKAKASKTPKSDKPKKERKPKDESKKGPIEKDAYGYRKGSYRSQIIHMLSEDTPVKMKGPGGIEEATGDTHYNDIHAMMDVGYVELAPGGGYILTGKTLADVEKAKEADAVPKEKAKKAKKADESKK